MEIMTVKEVSDFLRLKESTVCRLASDGKLPGVKIGKAWRFNKATLERMVNSEWDTLDAADGGTRNSVREL